MNSFTNSSLKYSKKTFLADDFPHQLVDTLISQNKDLMKPRKQKLVDFKKIS